MTFYFDDTERKRFLDELEKHWHRDVHVFRQPFSSPLATQDDFWSVIRNWAVDVRAGRRFVPPRWIDEDLVPRDSDAGLEAFCRRVDAQDAQDWYLYQGDGVQQWNGALWHRAAELVRPILGRMGELPPGGIRFELFLGRYSRTVTGVHRDEADGLAFVTLGPKRLYFWPRDAFEDHWASPEGTHFQTGVWNFEKHLDRAIAVEAEAGDVVYWPREYYHIGAAPDHWSAMVTLSMWWHTSAQRAVKMVTDAILGGDGPQVHYPFAFDDVAGGARLVPSALKHASQQAQAALQARWDDALSEAWARVATGYGFLTAPALTPPTAATATRFALRHPVAVLEIGARRHAFACGHRLPPLSKASLDFAASLEKRALGAVFEAPAGLETADRDALFPALLATGAIVAA